MNKLTENPLVSVVIPVYKAEQYLTECISSVVNQSLNQIEIIIVDKAEPDNSRKIIDAFEKKDPRIIAPHIKNSGAGSSYNIGLNMARGEYILLVESDDFIERDTCEKLYKYAKSLDADVVKAPYRIFFNDGTFQDCAEREVFSKKIPEDTLLSLEDCPVLLEYHASIWSCLYKREYLNKNNIRFVEAEGAGYVDVSFRIDTLTNTNRIVWLNIPFYNYRVDSAGSSTNTWNVSVMNKRWREIHERFVSRQNYYDSFLGQYLIADEYRNTYYRNKITPLSKEEIDEIKYNLTFIPEQVITNSTKLTNEEKEELFKLKAETPSNFRAKFNCSEETDKLPSLKIIVSHHNEENVMFDSPIYLNILSGAALHGDEELHLMRDDTGDNISAKNKSYCELTGQYWAWKHIDADYIGMCHYRRFLDFSDKVGKDDRIIDDHGQTIENAHLTNGVANKYRLLDEKYIRTYVSGYDAIAINTTPVEKIPTMDGYKQNLYDFWKRGCINLLEPGSLDMTLELIEQLYPKYYRAARAYMKQNQHRGYNTFILRKDLFEELCEFEFGILFALEKQLHPETHSALMFRMMGYIGEILSAIYLYHIQHFSSARFTSRPLVMFNDCKKDTREMLLPAFEDQNVPIVFTCSQMYVPYLSVCLQSIKNVLNEEKNYDIIILQTDIDAESRNKIKRMFLGNTNVKVRFYDPFNMITKQKFKFGISNYSDLPFYKVLLPWILPLHPNAIVLDSDLIINKDPSELLNIDMEGNCVEGVRDIVAGGLLNGIEVGWRDYFETELKLSNPYNYINAGVLVMDMDRIRSTFIVEKILSNGHRQLKLADQDFINITFDGKIKFLDLRWNYFVKSNWWVDACITQSPRADEAAHKKAIDNPYILHYANQPKPWDDTSIELSEVWWQVARQSPYYEAILQTHIVPPVPADPLHPMPVPEFRTGARKLADKVMPKGSKSREAMKKILPKGSHRWEFCKQVYYVFKPEYRPQNNK